MELPAASWKVVMLLHRKFEQGDKLPVAPPEPFLTNVVSISTNAAAGPSFGPATTLRQRPRSTQVSSLLYLVFRGSLDSRWDSGATYRFSIGESLNHWWIVGELLVNRGAVSPKNGLGLSGYTSGVEHLRSRAKFLAEAGICTAKCFNILCAVTNTLT